VYDDAFDICSGVLAYNEYAYCANNPVNCFDPTGVFLLSALIVGVVSVLLLVLEQLHMLII